MLSLLRDNKYYAGICMRDEISDLMKKFLSDGYTKFGFIYNTAEKGTPGEHWRAIWCDLKDGKHVCHYDSFGDPMEPDIKKALHKVLNDVGIPEFMKLKESRVKHQREKSQRCGYHCVLFIDRMSHGMSFIDATYVNEAIAAQLEKKFKRFGLV